MPHPAAVPMASKLIFTARKVCRLLPPFIIMLPAARRPRTAECAVAVILSCEERQFLRSSWNAVSSPTRRKHRTRKVLLIGKSLRRKLRAESGSGRRSPALLRRESPPPEPFRYNRSSIKPECAIRISLVPNARPKEVRKVNPQSTRNLRRARPIRILMRQAHRKRKNQRDIPRPATTTRAQNRRRSRRQRNRRADGLADSKLGANARRGRSRVRAWC